MVPVSETAMGLLYMRAYLFTEGPLTSAISTGPTACAEEHLIYRSVRLEVLWGRVAIKVSVKMLAPELVEKPHWPLLLLRFNP